MTFDDLTDAQQQRALDLGYSGLFSERETFGAALEYALKVADTCGDNKAGVITALYVLFNTAIVQMIAAVDVPTQAHDRAHLNVSNELVLPIGGANVLIIGPGTERRHGGYVRVVHGEEDEELGYWDIDEIAEDPEVALGAIFRCAAGNALDTKKENTCPTN